MTGGLVSFFSEVGQCIDFNSNTNCGS
jgi:hypothetical protein